MSDTESDDPGQLVTDEQLRSIKRILDARIETDEDYAELAKLVEREGYENVLVVDHDLDDGIGH